MLKPKHQHARSRLSTFVTKSSNVEQLSVEKFDRPFQRDFTRGIGLSRYARSVDRSWCLISCGNHTSTLAYTMPGSLHLRWSQICWHDVCHAVSEAMISSVASYSKHGSVPTCLVKSNQWAIYQKLKWTCRSWESFNTFFFRFSLRGHLSAIVVSFYFWEHYHVFLLNGGNPWFQSFWYCWENCCHGLFTCDLELARTLVYSRTILSPKY